MFYKKLISVKNRTLSTIQKIKGYWEEIGFIPSLNQNRLIRKYNLLELSLNDKDLNTGQRSSLAQKLYYDLLYTETFIKIKNIASTYNDNIRTILCIGPGSGKELITMERVFGKAAEITGIELNPVFIKKSKDYINNMANNPDKFKFINTDASKLTNISDNDLITWIHPDPTDWGISGGHNSISKFVNVLKGAYTNLSKNGTFTIVFDEGSWIKPAALRCIEIFQKAGFNFDLMKGTIFGFRGFDHDKDTFRQKILQDKDIESPYSGGPIINGRDIILTGDKEALSKALYMFDNLIKINNFLYKIFPNFRSFLSIGEMYDRNPSPLLDFLSLPDHLSNTKLKEFIEQRFTAQSLLDAHTETLFSSFIEQIAFRYSNNS